MRRRQTKYAECQTRAEAVALNDALLTVKLKADLTAANRELLRVTHEAAAEMIRKLFTPDEKAKSA